MRYLHLFLILNFVICYAGICGDTVFAMVSTQSAVESCHGSDHEIAATDESSQDIKSYGDQGSKNSPCCLDYLGGSSTSDNQATVFTVVDILPVIDIYSKNIQINRPGPGLLYKGHDPPDLQTSFSTFLL